MIIDINQLYSKERFEKGDTIYSFDMGVLIMDDPYSYGNYINEQFLEPALNMCRPFTMDLWEVTTLTDGCIKYYYLIGSGTKAHPLYVRSYRMPKKWSDVVSYAHFPDLTLLLNGLGNWFSIYNSKDLKVIPYNYVILRDAITTHLGHFDHEPLGLRIGVQWAAYSQLFSLSNIPDMSEILKSIDYIYEYCESQDVNPSIHTEDPIMDHYKTEGFRKLFEQLRPSLDRFTNDEYDTLLQWSPSVNIELLHNSICPTSLDHMLDYPIRTSLERILSQTSNIDKNILQELANLSIHGNIHSLYLDYNFTRDRIEDSFVWSILRAPTELSLDTNHAKGILSKVTSRVRFDRIRLYMRRDLITVELLLNGEVVDVTNYSVGVYLLHSPELMLEEVYKWNSVQEGSRPWMPSRYQNINLQ